jgi:methyl-accepting chemotaxis protein
MSSDNLFKEFLMTNKENPKYNTILENVNNRLINITKNHKGTLMASILDKNGIVIASTNKTSIGSDKNQEKSYLKAQEESYIGDVHISKISGIFAITIAAPVLLNGEFLGIIIEDHSTEGLFKIISEKTGLGKTGDIYLVNKDLYMISPSRFKEDVILKQKVDTINAKKSIINKSEKHMQSSEASIFRDYKGVNVLGAYENLPEMQWGLLAEIEENEALAPLHKLRFTFFGLLGFITIMAWSIGVFVSRLISRPINKLYEGAGIIGQGNLDFKVGTDSKDEIGRLSRAFDIGAVCLYCLP